MKIRGFSVDPRTCACTRHIAGVGMSINANTSCYMLDIKGKLARVSFSMTSLGYTWSEQFPVWSGEEVVRHQFFLNNQSRPH